MFSFRTRQESNTKNPGKYAGLRYLKTVHKGVMYRVVYDISEKSKEVLIIFLGTRENFYKELKGYLD